MLTAREIEVVAAVDNPDELLAALLGALGRVASGEAVVLALRAEGLSDQGIRGIEPSATQSGLLPLLAHSGRGHADYRSRRPLP